MKRFGMLTVLSILALVVVACAPMPAAQPAATAAPAATPMPAATTAPVADAKDIVDTAIGAGTFTTLVTAVQAAGLVDTLKGAGPFTVFAPTDEAFAKLPAGTVEGLIAEPEKLRDILLYHVVSGNVMAADAAKLTSADTVLGQPLTIKADGGKVMINEATVTTADIEASNGVIHVIDTVLLPPSN